MEDKEKYTENGTIELLKECDAGIKMGLSAIDELLEYAEDPGLRGAMERCKAGHERLKEEMHDLLNECNEVGKDPSAIAKGMSWLKTNVKLAMHDCDRTIADLLTDGCNMGVKSINRYLNRYPNASPQSREISQQLSTMEEQLAVEIRPYL